LQSVERATPGWEILWAKIGPHRQANGDAGFGRE